MRDITLAIAVLEMEGFDVWVQGNKIIFSKDDIFNKCIVKRAYSNEDLSPIFRVGHVDSDVRYFVVVLADTLSVWTIPVSDIVDSTTIRLGKRWECYKRVLMLEDKSNSIVEDNESLRAGAKILAQNLNQIKGKL